MSTVFKPTQEQLVSILADNAKWRAGTGGKRADLTGADLTRANLGGANLGGANLAGADLAGANLYGADLTRANLTWADLAWADLAGADLTRADLTRAILTRAILYGADLTGADLTRANLTGADLAGANLTRADLAGANLTRATLPEGITWEKYLAEVVPALLAAGGKAVADVLAAGAWDCHQWTNCPMAVAFGVDSLAGVPILLRPRASEFVRFFDARLIPMPRQLADGTWTCGPEPDTTTATTTTES